MWIYEDSAKLLLSLSFTFTFIQDVEQMKHQRMKITNKKACDHKRPIHPFCETHHSKLLVQINELLIDLGANVQFVKTILLLVSMTNVLRYVGTFYPWLTYLLTVRITKAFGFAKASLKYKRMLLLYYISVN